jgi:hypothetical protein
LFQLEEKNDPVTGRSIDLAEVGGLHQVVSELILSLFVDNRQKEKGGNLVSFVVSKKNRFLFIGDTV